MLCVWGSEAANDDDVCCDDDTLGVPTGGSDEAVDRCDAIPAGERRLYCKVERSGMRRRTDPL
jgi:hypothetical protein